ncbi:NAD-P-binding protein [Irpex rosettiformis]|uniref:NAD-P-binding protein n=1 Tax=Irpex rosettiformis TaxID=378272 RepID=A0ACB8U2P9_9APHY|nr:NAD-P-binding protein [Irpex rosettiformis]
MSSTENLFSVKGLVAVITGGGTGIGLMMATALENNGAIVYIVSRRLDILEKAASENSKYGNMIPIQCDITVQGSVQQLVETIKAQHGFINLLINNAGVAHNILPKLPGPDSGGIAAFQTALLQAGTREEFTQAFDFNLTSQYYCTVLFLGLLDAGNKRGNMSGVTSQVITVASGAAFRFDDKTFSVSYTLSKVAGVHLGKMLAQFLKDWQIRSNVFAPGFFYSEMTNALQLTDEQIRRMAPLQRAGNEDDVGGMILYLASKAGAYINGSVQLIDGGRQLLFPSTY